MSTLLTGLLLCDAVRKADDAEGLWITVNGQHILVGENGELKSGNPRVFGDSAPGSDSTAAPVMYGSRPVASEWIQKLSDKVEVEMASHLGIPRTGNNSPFDLEGKGVGVEIKTFVYQTNNKVTMNAAAIEAKLNRAGDAGLQKVFTVVVDKRSAGGRASYYLKEGVGSFRLGSMEKIGSLKALKARVRA